MHAYRRVSVKKGLICVVLWTSCSSLMDMENNMKSQFYSAFVPPVLNTALCCLQ